VTKKRLAISKILLMQSLEEENNMFKPCEKVTRFVMIKTEKTGSTTLFSILARYNIPNILPYMHYSLTYISIYSYSLYTDLS